MWTLTKPEALWLLLLPFSLTLYWLLAKRKTQKLFPLSILKLPEIQQELRKTRQQFRALFVLAWCGFIFLSIAIARPYSLEKERKKESEGIDIVVVLDVSESMEADDIKPNRIIAAKEVIRNFIHRRESDRIGLVVFGGEAVMKSPLTRDYDFLMDQVEAIELRELKQGTAIGMGLANGLTRLSKSKTKTRVVVLLTDGDSNVGAINPITAANLARQENIRVYTIGIGQSDRVVVPIYAHDMQGNRTHLIAQVPSYLNPELLKEMARITGGKAYMARDSDALGRILREIDQLEKSKVQILSSNRRVEQFFLPALLALGCFLLLFLLSETRLKRTFHGATV